MSEISDAEKFAELTKNAEVDQAKETGGSTISKSVEPVPTLKSEKTKEPIPGKVSQFSLYRGGYVPTTPTIPTLPSGIYSIESDSNCVYAKPMPKPSGLLLELPEMRSDVVIDIVENFWNSEKDYKEGNEFVVGGAIYRAGVMIYGPPGTGKSCTIKILSNKLVEKGGTVFHGSTHPSLVQSFLTDFATVDPNRKCIVILEDLDTLIYNYGEYQYLEMLDSAKTIDNVVFIATTNYPEKLNPRIYNRPGRFSSVIEVGYPGRKARTAFLQAILKKHDHVEHMVDNTSGFSIDHLSALVNAVYREKKSMDTEIARLRALFKINFLEAENESKSIGIAGIGPGTIVDKD